VLHLPALFLDQSGTTNLILVAGGGGENRGEQRYFLFNSSRGGVFGMEGETGSERGREGDRDGDCILTS
jgi:hypothetical protein